jgi:MGT family glycosyltransferase
MPDKVSFVGPLSSLRGEHGADLPWDSIRRGPTLFVSPGTVFARRPDFFDAVTRVFRDTAWTVVFATGATDPTLLRPLPVNVIARRTVPQLELLAHTTVFLTHGGMNSALEALAAGVPMLLAPRSGEQKTVAKMLVELGVGVLLGTGDLRGLVEDLASNRGVRRSLERLVPTFADPAGVAADLLVGQVSSAAEQTEW